MRKCLRGYAKDKDGNLSLVGTMSIPHCVLKNNFPYSHDIPSHVW